MAVLIALALSFAPFDASARNRDEKRTKQTNKTIDLQMAVKCDE